MHPNIQQYVIEDKVRYQPIMYHYADLAYDCDSYILKNSSPGLPGPLWNVWEEGMSKSTGTASRPPPSLLAFNASLQTDEFTTAP